MLDRLSEAFAAQRAFIDDADTNCARRSRSCRALGTTGGRPCSGRRLELVLDELSRMNRIVRDLQAPTKANQPGFVHPEPVELGGLFDELLVKAGAPDQHWELAHRDRGIVVVDRQRVTQAMLQPPPTQPDTARMTAASISGTYRGDTVELFVADSGPAFPRIATR